MIKRLRNWFREWKKRHTRRFYYVPEGLLQAVLRELYITQAYELTEALEQCKAEQFYSLRGVKQ